VIAARLSETVDRRLVIAVGLSLFAFSLWLTSHMTPDWGFAQLLVPQAVRGLSLMLCIVPSVGMALSEFAPAELRYASGLFNLMRNLGGAIGIAVMDTILTQRTPGHAAALAARLQAGDASAARLVGLPIALFRGHDMGPVDAMTRAIVTPLVKRAALVQSFNEAWFLMAALFAASLLLLPLIRRRG
jgi:DHA2 family multidrug resistance protein